MQENIQNTITNGGTPRQLTEIEKKTINSYSISNEAKKLVEEHWATKSSPMVKENYSVKELIIGLLIVLRYLMICISLLVLLSQYIQPEVVRKIDITIALIYVWIEIMYRIVCGVRGIILFLRFRCMLNIGLGYIFVGKKRLLVPDVLKVYQKKYIYDILCTTLLLPFLVLNAYTFTAIFLLIGLCSALIAYFLIRKGIKELIEEMLINP